MDKNRNLSPHFTLDEMQRSTTADLHHVTNVAPPEAVDCLRQLCLEVLEPLRQHLQAPVIINSGYRCPRLNTLVKGARNSQHMLGQAADIRTESARQAIEMMHFIMDNCRFDQLILENNAQGKRWVHVSYNAGKNRQQVLVIRA
ncbi:MAG: D-Ala-D-Ala carboxypeptidase family metallohydrolase [Bacteroidales bacterium]|nr:D-Ala-D-Ala carboxypeptidase family metallohydrolase [Bacteroidales bacterium]